jgi:hypothetical protein
MPKTLAGGARKKRLLEASRNLSKRLHCCLGLIRCFFESETPKPEQRTFRTSQLDIIIYCITHFVNVNQYLCQYSLAIQ